MSLVSYPISGLCGVVADNLVKKLERILQNSKSWEMETSTAGKSSSQKKCAKHTKETTAWTSASFAIPTSTDQTEHTRTEEKNRQQPHAEKWQKLKIERQAMVKDWIPDNELPKLYMTCDFGLLPFSDNLWTRCKCPSRLYEFMAMELPYICTVGEPAYMARKLDCGLIAKPEIEDFTEKMKYAIDHLEELKKGAKQGRKYLLENQDFNTLAEKLEAASCAALTH